METCQTPNLVKIMQKYCTLYMKAQVCTVVASNINLPQSHFVQLSFLYCLWLHATHRITFPLHQWLCVLATVLCCVHMLPVVCVKFCVGDLHKNLSVPTLMHIDL